MPLSSLPSPSVKQFTIDQIRALMDKQENIRVRVMQIREHWRRGVREHARPHTAPFFPFLFPPARLARLWALPGAAHLEE